MRNTFIDELVKLAKLNTHIALIVGDLGYSVVEPFADLYPERFINAGVAEQNMAGLAAGMASEGYHVFIYSIANFPTFRCAEQIRNDIDYHNLPVTVVSVGAGLSYGTMGYSHHAIQDYGLMRLMPNTLIASPGDPMEVRACIRYLVKNPQPSYLRLGKSGEPNIHSAIPEVTPGNWIPLKTLNDDATKAIVSTGTVMNFISKALLKNNELEGVSHYSMPLWGMKYKKQQHVNLNQFKKVLSIEDHLMDGGFGSWLAESIIENNTHLDRFSILGLNHDILGNVGSQESLNNIGGLRDENIIKYFTEE